MQVNVRLLSTDQTEIPESLINEAYDVLFQLLVVKETLGKVLSRVLTVVLGGYT
jgi:hypothetical protein